MAKKMAHKSGFHKCCKQCNNQFLSPNHIMTVQCQDNCTTGYNPMISWYCFYISAIYQIKYFKNVLKGTVQIMVNFVMQLISGFYLL